MVERNIPGGKAVEKLIVNEYIDSKEVNSEEAVVESADIRGFIGDIFIDGDVGERDAHIVSYAQTRPTPLKGDLHSVKVKNDIMYMTDSTNGELHLSNLGPEGNLVPLTSYSSDGSRVTGVEVYKGYAYIIEEDNNQIEVIDVRNKPNISQVGVLSDRALSSFEDIDVRDDVLYVCASGDVSEGEMIAVDVSSPSDPSILDRVEGADRVEIKKEFAYTVNVDKTESLDIHTYFRIWDISELGDLSMVYEFQGNYYYDISIQGDRLYAPRHQTGFDVVYMDVFDITEPPETFRVNNPQVGIEHDADYIEVRGDFIYGVRAHGDIQTYRIEGDDVYPIVRVDGLGVGATNVELYGDYFFAPSSSGLVMMGPPKRQDKGVVTLSSGSTTVTVSHDLPLSPSPEDIIITPHSDLGSASYWYINNIGSSSFDLNVDADPTQNVDFAWKIDI